MVQVGERVLSITDDAGMSIGVDSDRRLARGHVQWGRHLVAILTQMVHLVV